MMALNNPRGLAFLGLVTLAVASALGYALATPTFDAHGGRRVMLFLILGGAGMALPFCWPTVAGKREAWLLLGLAGLLRIALWPTAPSDDIHRYLWEGKLVAAGLSPYEAPADDPRYAAFRDRQWEQMNNLDKRTAYPPAALVIFAALGELRYAPWFFKLAFSVLDLAVVALLIDCLRRRSLPLRWVGFYAFNPVALVAFAGEGHFDVLMILPLVGAFALWDRGKKGWSVALVSLAVLMKIIAVLALPFLLKRTGWRYAWAAVLPLGLCIPFLGDWSGFVQGVVAFGAERSFNGGLYEWVHALLGDRRSASLVVGMVLAVLLAWRFFLRPGADWAADWVFACGALLVLAPTFHFWYLTWLLPWVALRPSLAWLVFSVTQGFYFLVWQNESQTQTWDLYGWQSALIWTPFLVLGLYELVYFHRRKPPPGDAPPEGVSVIIPALNAATELPGCLESIRRSTVIPDEIILVDGASSDETVGIAEGAGCRTATSEPGRGQQIAVGVRLARFRYRLILHADCRLPPAGIQRMIEAFRSAPDVAGGALGQRFDAAAPMLVLIEAMNEFRAVMGAIPFGDQAQFYDRARLRDAEFPSLPLMEDVELALRLRGRGRVIYLGEEVVSSSAKWQIKGSWERISQVIRLVVAYRWVRLWSKDRAAALSRDLYREYYGK